MSPTVPILMYHSVADEGPAGTAPYRVSAAAFRQQMQFLRAQGYRSIFLDEWADCIEAGRAPDPRCCIITFDDGYRNIVQNALPVLADTGFHATVFVVTGRVGGVADWDRVYGDPLVLLDWDELRRWQQHGHTIGSHCVVHCNLQELSDAAIVADAREARATLHRQLGVDARAIAYPWGLSDERVRRLLADSGYRIGVDVVGGPSRLGDPLMLLPRIEIFGEDDLAAFARKLDRTDREADTRDGGFGTAMSALPGLRRAEPADAAEERRIRVDELRALADRIARLIADLSAVLATLNEMQQHDGAALPMRRPELLHRKLVALFGQPLTGHHPMSLVPYQEVSPGVQIGLPPEARATLAIEPQPDTGVAADYPNRLRLAFSGGPWLSVELSLAAAELAEAQRFRLTLGARVSRRVPCLISLRRPELGAAGDITLGYPQLDPGKPNYVLDGPFVGFAEPGPIVKLLLILQTGSEDLEIVVDSIDLHIASTVATA